MILNSLSEILVKALACFEQLLFVFLFLVIACFHMKIKSPHEPIRPIFAANKTRGFSTKGCVDPLPAFEVGLVQETSHSSLYPTQGYSTALLPLLYNQ